MIARDSAGREKGLEAQGEWRFGGRLGIFLDTLSPLTAGQVIGWRFELNGRDWNFPETEGHYEVFAQVAIDLSEPRGDPEVGDYLRRHAELDEDMLAVGQWTSNSVPVVRVALQK